MRHFVLVILFTLASHAFAANTPADYALLCTTSVSGLSLSVVDGKMHLHLDDSAGFKDFPIFSGVVTPYMLSLVNRGAKDLKQIDGTLDVTYDLSKCKVDPKRPFLISCSGPGTIETPKTKTLIATSLSTSTDVIDNLDVQAQTVNVNLGLSTTDTAFRHYFVNFPFDSNHCEMAQPQTASN